MAWGKEFIPDPAGAANFNVLQGLAHREVNFDAENLQAINRASIESFGGSPAEKAQRYLQRKAGETAIPDPVINKVTDPQYSVPRGQGYKTLNIGAELSALVRKQKIKVVKLFSSPELTVPHVLPRAAEPWVKPSGLAGATLLRIDNRGVPAYPASVNQTPKDVIPPSTQNTQTENQKKNRKKGLMWLIPFAILGTSAAGATIGAECGSVDYGPAGKEPTAAMRYTSTPDFSKITATAPSGTGTPELGTATVPAGLGTPTASESQTPVSTLPATTPAPRPTMPAPEPTLPSNGKGGMATATPDIQLNKRLGRNVKIAVGNVSSLIKAAIFTR